MFSWTTIQGRPLARPVEYPRLLAAILLALACSSPFGSSRANAQAVVPPVATPQAPRIETSASQQESAAVETYMGRTIAPPMDYSGAGWLTRATRVSEEDPARLLRFLELKKGQVVCDFGCGNGYHTLQIAKRVGPQGIVYAVDIQQEMLDLLAERAEPRGVENIKPILASATDPQLPPATFDLVLMVDVYHELSDPPEVLAAVRASLKPAGRLVLVEFREEDPGVPIRPLHKMSQQQVLNELEPNGFKLVDQYNALPWQHVLAFGRDDSPAPAVALQPWKPQE